MVALTLALCGTVAYELSRHGLHWKDVTDFGTDAIKLIKYLLPWSSQTQLPPDLSHFGVVATVLAMIAAIFKKGQTFGIDPAKLTDNLRDAATIKDVKPDPGNTAAVLARVWRSLQSMVMGWTARHHLY